MIWPFRKRTPPETTEPEENSLDRKKLIVEQHKKLRRAHELKARSSAVAGSLQKEGRANGYGDRLFEAYRLAEGNR